MARVMKAGLLVVSLLVVTACGSTVSVTGTAASGNGLGVGDASTPAPIAGGTGSAPGGSVGSATGSASGGATSTTGSAGTGTSGTTTGDTAGGTTALPGGNAVGVTATTITVGLPYSVNSKAAAAALGVSGAGVGGGDQRAQWKAIIDDINSHGGVLGRKVVPQYHAFDSTSTQSLDQQYQAACSDWTQDHHVFAVLEGDSTQAQTLLQCLSKKGVVQVWESPTLSDTATFKRFPHYIEVGTLGMDRVARAWPKQLLNLDYFSGWNTVTGTPAKVPAKVGILTFDNQVSVNAVDTILVPALKAMGLTPIVAKVLYPSAEADNGTSIAQIQNAVLKFKASGVTHVLPYDSQGAGILGFFAQGANSQKYYPRYGLSSNDGAQILYNTNLIPKAQLNGAVGFGWEPFLDVSDAYNPDNGPDSNSARRSCLALMKKNGQDVSSSIVKRQAIQGCDQFSFLKAALGKSGGNPTPASFLTGVDSMGESFVSGVTFRTHFDSLQHNGVAAVRAFGYVPACDCFRYTGPLTTVS